MAFVWSIERPAGGAEAGAGAVGVEFRRAGKFPE